MGFKVGDKVRILDAKSIDLAEIDGFETGGIYKVVELDRFNHPILADGESRLHFYKSELQYIEKVEPKKSKNQRIKELESELQNLKEGYLQDYQEMTETIRSLTAKVESLETLVNEHENVMTAKGKLETFLHGESEPQQDEIIEFEGNQYRKVDREAREGDVAIVRYMKKNNPGVIELNTPYKVIVGKHRTNLKWDGFAEVYSDYYGRTSETVDVYELFAYGTQEKSPNQLRAEIIEKAKRFVDENGGDDYHFEVNEEDRSVFAWKIIDKNRNYSTLAGFTKCSPNDVYNEFIGRAIAFGRAEGLDVSEFEQAVQPDEVVVGHVVRGLKTGKIDTVVEITGAAGSRELVLRSFYPWEYTTDSSIKEILDDTNAIYEVNANR